MGTVVAKLEAQGSLMTKEISLAITRRFRSDKDIMARVVHVQEKDQKAVMAAIPSGGSYFVVPVEGADSTPMMSAYCHPQVKINDTKLHGYAFVQTNNFDKFHFPFTMRAFRGLLYVDLVNQAHALLTKLGSMEVELTFEDNEGNTKP